MLVFAEICLTKCKKMYQNCVNNYVYFVWLSLYRTDDDVTKRPHPEDDALSNPQHRRLLKAMEEEIQKPQLRFKRFLNVESTDAKQIL